MEKKGPITGTFIDEITYDIPSSNWSLEQWRRDLDNMQEIGIDTVIFIRGGFEDKAVFPSKMLGNHYAKVITFFRHSTGFINCLCLWYGYLRRTLYWFKGYRCI